MFSRPSIRVILWLAWCLCAASTHAQSYWDYLLHRETLGSPLPFTVAQFSSYDRGGGNDDYATYYGTDTDGSRILCDTTGPGVVTQFWCTVLNLPDTLHWKIYVDNMTTPLIYTTARQLFGHVPPFEPPLADTMNYGRFCYVPIPFQQRIKITSGLNGGIYYHFTVLRFPPEWTVESLTIPPSQAYMARLDSLADLFLNPAAPLMPGQAVDVSTGIQTVGPGQTATLLDVAQSGTCRRIKLWMDQHTQAVNDSIWLSIYVDNYPLAVMSGPVCSLFGAALGWRPYTSAVTGMTGDSLYFNLPFPFRSSLRLIADNRSAQNRTVRAVAEVIAQPPAQVRPLRLLSVYRQETPTIPWNRYQTFDVSGPGQYVGLFWQMYGSNHNTLEGDERFYFNGASGPSWNGTGTEDYFNGGYFWADPNGAVDPYQLATHGVLALGGGSAAAYRWHVMDPVPFTQSLRMTMEPGGYSQNASNIRTSALVFARLPRWRLIDISGDDAVNYGEAAHLVGYGLNPGSVLSEMRIGSQLFTYLSGSFVVNGDSILDMWARAPFEGEGVYPVTCSLDGQPETIAAAYTLAGGPRLSFSPLRLDMDTLVFRGDTLSVRCDGINPGESATVMSAGIPFAWVETVPVADTTGALTGDVIVPPGLPTGDLTVTAISSGVPDAQSDQLLRHRRYYRLEAEILPRISWHGTSLRERWAPHYEPPNQQFPWGRNLVLQLDGAVQGDSVNLRFSFPDSGNFRFAYFFARSGGAAIVQTRIDGQVDIDGLDTYGAGLDWRISRMDTVYGPWRDLSAGTHTLTLTAVGRNPAANGWDIWLDQFIVLQEYPINAADDVPEVVDGYAFDQNYPNPFNPTTQVRFVIPRTERVSLKIYDVLGRETQVLADRVFTAGPHVLTWNCSDCASGVYFLQLSTPSHQMVKKAVVLR